MKSKTRPRVLEIDMKDLFALVEQARTRALTAEQCQTLQRGLEALARQAGLLAPSRSTEKTKDVLPAASAEEGNEEASAEAGADPDVPKKRRGHGRNGHDEYQGAARVHVPHESLQPGDPCPDCKKGKVYELSPAVHVRVTGRPPLDATAYECQRLRCNLCGAVSTAALPKGIGEEKYDVQAAAMIGLLRYGSGFPFNRLEGLQGHLEIPLPASTQWDLVNESVPTLEPVFEELVRYAAQGDVLHNDDTSMRVLELTGKRRAKDESIPSDRTGTFTSGIVSTREGQRIALYVTGWKHAGENLADVLKSRAAQLSSPVLMCDGLSRNEPSEFATILANCLAHARRYFVGTVDCFPEESQHVLLALRQVYRNDAVAKERGLSPEERLRFHQAESQSILDDLKKWMNAQLDDHLVEPNSPLGKAIQYMTKRWDRLTLFLHKPGVPLDNNVCERALKKAILHRNNSLFYKTRHGAHVGDLFQSLIHTAELSGANPFAYLTALLQNPTAVAAEPSGWLPWNYTETLAAAASTHRLTG